VGGGRENENTGEKMTERQREKEGVRGREEREVRRKGQTEETLTLTKGQRN